MSRLILCAAILSLLSGCPSCDAVETPPQERPAGGLNVAVSGGTATVNLSGVAGSLRAVQVDVVVAGGTATAIDGLGHDLVEAGLDAENGGPKSSFTVVVADTRRLPVNNGGIARLTIDEGATVSLSNAFGIDAAGTKRALATDGN